MPSIRWNLEKEAQVVASLRDASKGLSRKLGYTGKKDYAQDFDPHLKVHLRRDLTTKVKPGG